MDRNGGLRGRSLVTLVYKGNPSTVIGVSFLFILRLQTADCDTHPEA